MTQAVWFQFCLFLFASLGDNTTV
uniref:Uncharacterized protein n=1 Tax=Anguilla anguilla TaxID=7936 RepID=A0A0E9TS73_ANGAN